MTEETTAAIITVREAIRPAERLAAITQVPATMQAAITAARADIMQVPDGIITQTAVIAGMLPEILTTAQDAAMQQIPVMRADR